MVDVIKHQPHKVFLLWYHHQMRGQPRLKRHLLPMRKDWSCWTPTQCFNVQHVMNKHGVSRSWYTETDVKYFKSGALSTITNIVEKECIYLPVMTEIHRGQMKKLKNWFLIKTVLLMYILEIKIMLVFLKTFNLFKHNPKAKLLFTPI